MGGLPNFEFRPDFEGNFDELFARFADGSVFIETMTDKSVYLDFAWGDETHLQLWISSNGKLRYYSEPDAPSRDRNGNRRNRATGFGPKDESANSSRKRTA